MDNPEQLTEAEKGKKPRDHGGSAAAPKVYCQQKNRTRVVQSLQPRWVGRTGFEPAAQFLPPTSTFRKCVDGIYCNMFL